MAAGTWENALEVPTLNWTFSLIQFSSQFNIFFIFILMYISEYFGVVYRVILPPGVGFYTRFMQVDVWTQSDSIFTTLASPDQDIKPRNNVASLLHKHMNKF